MRYRRAANGHKLSLLRATPEHTRRNVSGRREDVCRRPVLPPLHSVDYGVDKPSGNPRRGSANLARGSLLSSPTVIIASGWRANARSAGAGLFNRCIRPKRRFRGGFAY
jgi:hypothetical protein